MVLVAFVAALAGYTTYSTCKETESMSRLVEANIEALANGESDGIADCDNGCSTSNNGPYCCTIKTDKASFDLYYDEQRN